MYSTDVAVEERNGCYSLPVDAAAAAEDEEEEHDLRGHRASGHPSHV